MNVIFGGSHSLGNSIYALFSRRYVESKGVIQSRASQDQSRMVKMTEAGNAGREPEPGSSASVVPYSEGGATWSEAAQRLGKA